MKAKIATVLAGLTLLATGQPLAAYAANGARPHAVAHAAHYIDYLEGNAKYLVYGKRVVGGAASLYVMSRNGTVRRLGPWHADPDEGLDYDFSLVGSTLTSGSVGGTAYWWDLAAHTSGTLPLKQGDYWYASVPDGYLFIRDDQRYYTESIHGGPVTALNPDLDNVQAGPTGYIGLKDVAGDGRQQFQSWEGGPLVPLDFTHNCFHVSKYYAECRSTDDDGNFDGAKVLPLDGSSAITISPNPKSGPIALLKRIAWRSTNSSPITFRAADGTITKSASVTGRMVGDAFLKVVLVRGSGTLYLEGQELVGLANAGSAPVVLARA